MYLYIVFLSALPLVFSWMFNNTNFYYLIAPIAVILTLVIAKWKRILDVDFRN